MSPDTGETHMTDLFFYIIVGFLVCALSACLIGVIVGISFGLSWLFNICPFWIPTIGLVLAFFAFIGFVTLDT